MFYPLHFAVQDNCLLSLLKHFERCVCMCVACTNANVITDCLEKNYGHRSLLKKDYGYPWNEKRATSCIYT